MSQENPYSFSAMIQEDLLNNKVTVEEIERIFEHYGETLGAITVESLLMLIPNQLADPGNNQRLEYPSFGYAISTMIIYNLRAAQLPITLDNIRTVYSQILELNQNLDNNYPTLYAFMDTKTRGRY